MLNCLVNHHDSADLGITQFPFKIQKNDSSSFCNHGWLYNKKKHICILPSRFDVGLNYALHGGRLGWRWELICCWADLILVFRFGTRELISRANYLRETLLYNDENHKLESVEGSDETDLYSYLMNHPKLISSTKHYLKRKWDKESEIIVDENDIEIIPTILFVNIMVPGQV